MSVCTPWATTEDLDACCTSTATPQQKTDALLAASEILYALSGRQFSGECTETVRPCSGGAALPGFAWGRWTYPWTPIKFGATWVNIGPACGCHMAWDCGCKGIPQVNLGRSDVTEVTEVLIDGVVLSADSYRLDDNRYLVRTDGGFWPCCQDLAKPDTEAGTWSISLAYGFAPPQMGKNAALRLACELSKSCVGAECALPERVTTLSRQGVTMTLIDPQDFLTAGRTGLLEVDYFLQATNPAGLQRRATVWSPEVAGRRR